jgi:hypothetical protein
VLELEDLSDDKKEATHGPRLIRVQSGHIIITSQHPATSQINAQEQTAAFYRPTPSSTPVEQGSHLAALAERATRERSTPLQDKRIANSSDSSQSAPSTPPRDFSVHMSDISFYSSIDDNPYHTGQIPSRVSCAQLAVTEPSPVRLGRIPIIRVQQPTRDASLALPGTGTPELASGTEICESRAPLWRGPADSDTGTVAYDDIVMSPDQAGKAALPLQTAIAGSPLVAPKPPKARLLLRKCRNRLATEPLLNLTLGRSVAKVTKPALRLAAHPTEAVSATGEAGSIVQS